MAVSKKKLKDLKFDDRNINKGSELGQSLLEKSLREGGAGRSILIDRNGVIIAGNQTAKKAEELGINDVIVVPSDGKSIIAVQRTDIDINTPEGAKLKILDNTVSKHNYVEDAEVMEAVCEEYDLTPAEFGLQEAKVAAEAEEDDYEIPDEIKNSPVVLGDLFQVGNHRLLCGDSTSSDDFEKLFDGERIDLVFSDPPYGVKAVSKNGTLGGENLCAVGVYKQIIGDDTTETAQEFYQTCQAFGIENYILWGGNYFTDFLPPKACWIIWDKRGDMNSNNFADGEVAWTSFDTPLRIKKQVWAGMIKEGESGKRVHPTQKPVKLCADLIQEYAKGNNILDGFGGSGSTMVACEQIGKKCFMIEMSPDYVFTILKRMKNLDKTLQIRCLNRNLDIEKELN